MKILKKKESQFGSARAMKVLYVDLDIVQHSDSLILILSRCHWYLPCSLAVIGICPTLSLSLVFALLSRCHWYLPSSLAVIGICPADILSIVQLVFYSEIIFFIMMIDFILLLCYLIVSPMGSYLREEAYTFGWYWLFKFFFSADPQFI